MNHQFLIRPVQLSQAFESNSSSGGSESGEITRRRFIKRTGGATVATLVAWNLASNSANANEDESGSGSSPAMYLVCTNAPTYAQPGQSNIGGPVTVTLTPTVIKRDKTDVLVLDGPVKGDFIWTQEGTEAKFKLTATLVTMMRLLDAQDNIIDSKSYIAKDEQEAVADGDEVIWRSDAAVGTLLDDSHMVPNNPSGSPLSGAVRLEKGKLDGASLWAGLSGTRVLTFTINLGVIGRANFFL
jgi:hypothetical protein